ncbi:MAG: ABC transporter permease subunit [Spirochaetaceae bacterium]|nr:ABC transporter permease subunit [Spirochaetaceae bacterium]
MASESLADSGTRSARRSRLWRELARDYQLHLIIALPVIWFIIFKYLPMYGAQIAFRDFAAAKGIWGSPWVGLDHFQRFFESYLFWRIVGNTFFLSIYTLAATFPIPILLALSINNANSRLFRKTVQMVIYAPYFISTVVMVGLLIQFLSTSVGVVGPLMLALGMKPVSYMGRPEAFQSIYVWSHVWQFSGFGTIIYLAALAGIDPELHEAAIIDGATKVQRTRFIDIPGIMPTAVILFILTLGQLMNIGFEKVYNMQNDLNLERSEVIQTYVYKIGLTGIPRFSYASAIGLFNSAINFALIMVGNWIAKRLGGASLW